MNKPLIIFFLAFSLNTSHCLDLFFSGSYGWTHYKAEDLNKFMRLLERKTNAGGFNPYAVQGFDGHSQGAVTAGIITGPIRLGLETEFWTETFHQEDVAFDMGNPDRDYRISCSDLIVPGYVSDKEFGCIQASEEFLFLPITLQLTYSKRLWKYLGFDLGYGIGILGGSSKIALITDFYSEMGNDDAVEYSIDPGINLLQKLIADLEFLPCSWSGIQLRLGYRISKLKKIMLSDKKGESTVFNAIFGNPEEGDELFFESFGDLELEEEIFIGKQDEYGRSSELHRVTGDFTGWFAAIKLNFYWRGL